MYSLSMKIKCGIQKILAIGYLQKMKPIYDSNSQFNQEEDWKDNLLFNEYFHGDTGVGLGALHQGWTSLIAKLQLQSGGKGFAEK